MIKRKLTEELAQSILKEKRELLESINLSQTEIEERIAECWQVYLKYKKACDLKEEGYSARRIAEQLSLSCFNVSRWTKGGLPLVFNEVTHFSELEMKLSEETRQDLLYLLGAFQGKKVLRENQFSEFASKYKQELETLVFPIYQVFSRVPKITLVRDYWRFYFRSKKFLDYFNQHTEQDQHLPWKLMPTLKEKEAYFKGYFLKSSAINGERIIFRFSCEPVLKTEFAVLLGDLGLVPGCNSREVELFDYVDLKKILDEGWCLSRRKELALRKITRQKIDKRNCSPEKILILLDQIKQGRITRPEAIDKYALPRNTLQSWICDNVLPYRVRRYLKLNEMIETVRTDPCYSYVETDVPLKYLFNMFVPEKDLRDPELVKTHHRSFYRYLKDEPDYPKVVKRKGKELYIAWGSFSYIERLLTSSLPGYEKRSLEEAKELTKRLE